MTENERGFHGDLRIVTEIGHEIQRAIGREPTVHGMVGFEPLLMVEHP